MKESRENCVFCRILDGGYPISEVYSDSLCVALMTTEPVNEGHAMVIPRQHLSYLEDLPPDLTAHIFLIGQHLAAAIRSSGVPCDGVNLFVADGEAAEQEVFHFHLHVYPRTQDDGFGFKYDDRHFKKPPPVKLDRLAARIRTQMYKTGKPVVSK